MGVEYILEWVEEFILWHLKMLFKSRHLLFSCQIETGPPFTQKALPLELQCEKYKLQSEVVPWDRSSCPDWGWEVIKPRTGLTTSGGGERALLQSPKKMLAGRVSRANPELGA